MKNREIIKNTLDQNINKEKIYTSVIKEAKKQEIRSLAYAACFIILILVFGVTIYNKGAKFGLANIERLEENAGINSSTETYIKPDESNQSLSNKLGLTEEVKFEDIVEEENILKKIRFPKNIKEERCLKLYNLDSKNETVKEFMGYNIIFGNESRGIDIFASKTIDSRVGEYDPFIESILNNINISGVDVKIGEYTDGCYIIKFKYEEWNIDIRTSMISEDEVMDFIKNIVK